MAALLNADQCCKAAFDFFKLIIHSLILCTAVDLIGLLIFRQLKARGR